MKLQVKNLSARYENELILADLTMDVQDGEFISVIGPSGCGKSTFLNILAGILPQEEGEIFVDGKLVQGLSAHFAYMPQDDLLMPWKNILDNVCLYASLHGQENAAKEDALSKLDQFGLAGYGNRYPRELSGGMRQRAAFLRTALCPAEIMLLDEPFASLDVITRSNMQDWLLSMRQSLSRTTILVTHDIDEAIYLSDRILVLAGQPAAIKKVIHMEEKNRNRDWLFEQVELRSKIYQYLQEVMR